MERLNSSDTFATTVGVGSGVFVGSGVAVGIAVGVAVGFGVSVGLGVAVGATVSCTASVASIDVTSVLSFTESAVFIVSEFPMATANEMMNAIAIIRGLNSLLFF